MRVDEFINKLKLAEQSKTLYTKGCFGAPMTAANKKRYTSNLQYNANRANLINACSTDTFGFDCVCLIKGILWGWTADKSKSYGGAAYNSNGVPDVSADGIVKYLQGVTTDFSNIIPGEVVWMSGHVGIYVGDGKVIECTPKWKNNVQYSNLGNLGYTSGNSRIWTKHGRLPWVDYSTMPSVEKPQENGNMQATAAYHTVMVGDTMSKIAQKYGMTLDELKKLNPDIKNVNLIYVGQKINIRQPEEMYYTVVKGDNMTKIAKQYGMTLAQLKKLNPQIPNASLIQIGWKIRVN